MADEKKETPEIQENTEAVPPVSSEPEFSEFDGKSAHPSKHKDLWLFLIIIDAVFLCIFGVLLYQNISAKLLNPAAQGPSAVEEIVTVTDEVIIPEPTPAAKPVAEVVEVEETTVAVAAKEPAPEPVVAVAAPVEEPEKPAPAVQEKKQSVVVSVNPKSKYRQVTFRYFGDAKAVSVVSGFTMAKPRAMTKKGNVWEVTLAIAPGNYKYLFIVDGKKTTDPYAEEKDGRSVLVLE